MGRLALDVLRGIEGIEVWPQRFVGDKPDAPYLLFSASYPKRIPEDLLAGAALGAVNLHTGLLPEGRGWHPLNWALIWGRDKTGITIHKIVDSFDAGDICVQHEVPIFDTDTIVELRARVDATVPQVIAAFFEQPEHWISYATKQNQAHMTYAPKRRPEDSEINFEAPWRDVWNLYRSCDPVAYPAFVTLKGEKYRVENGRMVNGIFRWQLNDYGVT